MCTITHLCMDALYALGIDINNGAKAYALANGDGFQ